MIISEQKQSILVRATRAAQLQLNLAGREGFILHDYSAAASQHHDVEILLLLMGLLVPLPHNLWVMGRNQGDLPLEKKIHYYMLL